MTVYIKQSTGCQPEKKDNARRDFWEAIQTILNFKDVFKTLRVLGHHGKKCGLPNEQYKVLQDDSCVFV